MRFFVFTFFLFLSNSNFLVAQKFDARLTDTYAFYVKNIDDFFERFNFKKSTAFYKYVVKTNPDVELLREHLLYSLFKTSNVLPIKNKVAKKQPVVTLKPEDVSEFISQVCNVDSPCYLKYKDSEWFAELKCSVLYKNRPQILTLILKVEHFENDAFAWSIVGANAPFFPLVKEAKGAKILDISKYVPESERHFLSPVSHGLEFQDVRKIFGNKKHAADYVYESAHTTGIEKLLLLISKSEIKFVQVNKVTYHLLQINGWIVVIEKFKMKERNSGWLISELRKADDSVKKEFKKKKLYLPDTLF